MEYIKTVEELLEIIGHHLDPEALDQKSVEGKLEIYFNFKYLGYSSSKMDGEYFWTAINSQTLDHYSKYLATPNVIDFLINSGVMAEPLQNRSIIKLFGYSQGGRIGDILALNTRNVFGSTGVLQVGGQGGANLDISSLLR
jgi:hypothetical protein